ncbi:hypothetical protein HO133_003236 [Letharia lupina]|uniref:Uncharacterized protein n=1 Tax=Letharia lupina TaxID=560253 RepID=A0A8H6CAY5_9LECA|nr:uncharacterized protein HO133_003236 [Letharia lupina]KAF6220105.1 hypothetical protein HO133_003236 [Letharia lupina]
MVNFLLPLLLSLATSSINAASLTEPSLGPSISMNLTDLYSSVTNTTSLGDGGTGGIDPRFTVNYHLGGIPLRPIACLMNAVNAMTKLALQDFDADILPIVARLPSYSDVVIRSGAATLSPGTIPIRFILWGIWSSALLMMTRYDFQTMHLTLNFDGAVVGYLGIEKPDPQNPSLAGSNDGSSGGSLERRSNVELPAMSPSKTLANFTMLSNRASLSLTNTTAPHNAGNLRVFINPVGQSLTNNEFFIPILAGLDYVARFPSTSPVYGFVVRPSLTDAWIEFRDYGARPRTEAPFFEYQWIAKALWELPGSMVPGRWREAVIVMQVDGVNVGDGWFRKGES